MLFLYLRLFIYFGSVFGPHQWRDRNHMAAAQVILPNKKNPPSMEDFLFYVKQGNELKTLHYNYSTVTDLAKFLGWSTLQPRKTAMW